MAIFKVKDATRIFFTIFPVFSASNYVEKYSQTFELKFYIGLALCGRGWSIFRPVVRWGIPYEKFIEFIYKFHV